VMPLMTADDAAIVFLASVLAGWDTHAGSGRYSASQAGLLALMRSLALSGGPDGIRVNAVAIGLVGDDQGSQAMPPEVRGRIPLGRAASPDDIVDAIMFLLSVDAGHITDSTLVVDGGQSLQSWSNAPRVGHYPQPLLHESLPQPPPRPEGTRYPAQCAGRGAFSRTQVVLPSPRSEGARRREGPGMRG
jgi:hypothetical protein